jgi:hypothetical protein
MRSRQAGRGTPKGARLIDEFRGRLAETPHSWVEWASSQLLQNTALHLLVEWGKQRFGC